MKRKLIVGGIIALALTATAAIVSAELGKVKGSDQFEAAGAGIKEPAAAMLENDSKNSVPGESDIMGEVCGQKVTKLYFELQYSSFKTHPLNYANPKEKAWDSIKQEFWEKAFAAENGLTPTAEEIDQYVEYNKREFATTEEGRSLIKAYADGMGMTVNQYWEYNRKYQAPVAVTHGKVAEYLEANQITAPAPAEIDGQITDLEYYESLQ